MALVKNSLGLFNLHDGILEYGLARLFRPEARFDLKSSTDMTFSRVPRIIDRVWV